MYTINFELWRKDEIGYLRSLIVQATTIGCFTCHIYQLEKNTQEILDRQN